MERINKGPILKPTDNKWESNAVFNPGAIKDKNGKIHILYRAVGNYEDYVNRLGHAIFTYNKDDKELKLKKRSKKPVFSPEFLRKNKILERLVGRDEKVGVEDPRIARVKVDGKEKYWLTIVLVTNPDAPPQIRRKAGLSKLKDRKWQAYTLLTEIKIKNGKTVFSKDPKDYWIITPRDRTDKDVVPFPKKINNKTYFLERRAKPGMDMNIPNNRTRLSTQISYLDEENMVLKEAKEIIPLKNKWESWKNGPGIPPIETKEGFLEIYHGVNKKKEYRAGACLFEKNNPEKIIKRTNKPILQPEKEWEKEGDTPNVVFPTGCVRVDNELILFYGTADKYCGAARAKIEDIFNWER